jgi:RNA polymerase sigma factor (sigma-70 family)
MGQELKGTGIPQLTNSELEKVDAAALDPQVRKFVDFYLQTRVPLRAYIYGFLKNSEAIEDCIQETCMLVWNKQQEGWTLDEYQKFSYTTARFKALSWLKKHQPKKHVQLSPAMMEKLADRTLQVEPDHRISILNDCLDRLSPEQRNILDARYEAADSQALQLLANSLSRKVDSLYKQLERLRTILRDCVRKELPYQ